MLLRKTEIEKEINRIEKELKKFPSIGISCSKNANCKTYRWQYYKSKKDYGNLSKKDIHLAQKLVLRKYLLALKADLESELLSVHSYLENYHTTNEVSKFLNNPEQRRLIQPYFCPLDEELAEWAAAPYEKSTEHPESLIQEISPGVFVRSKSEAMIAKVLQNHNIPFHYEEKLVLSGKIFYPDFKIRHPKTGKIFYYEHFGRMDDPSYRNRTNSKLHTYAFHGIYPFDQLIITYETENDPLTYAKVEKLVKEYFL